MKKISALVIFSVLMSVFICVSAGFCLFSPCAADFCGDAAGRARDFPDDWVYGTDSY